MNAAMTNGVLVDTADWMDCEWICRVVGRSIELLVDRTVGNVNLKY